MQRVACMVFRLRRGQPMRESRAIDKAAEGGDEVNKARTVTKCQANQGEEGSDRGNSKRARETVPPLVTIVKMWRFARSHPRTTLCLASVRGGSENAVLDWRSRV